MTSYPFAVQRRIGWGECDPARIYYTPRAVDCAVEAVDEWFEKILRVSWPELTGRDNLDAPFVRIDCDYRRPLVAGQIIRLHVEVAGIGRSSLTLAVSAVDAEGEICFLCRLAACFVDRKDFSPIPIPAGLRERIMAYRARCREAAVLPTGSEGEGRADDCRGRISRAPGGETEIFARKRRVAYGECTPSGIVYAPRVFDYVVEVVGEWYEEVPGVSWMDLVCRRGQGAPFVSAGCAYLRPLVSGQTIEMEVRVTRLGGASVGFAVAGYDEEGRPCLDARLTACFIDQNGFRAMPVPEDMRKRIAAYQDACGFHDRKDGSPRTGLESAKS